MWFMLTQLYKSFYYMNPIEKFAWAVFLAGLLLSAQEGQRNYRKIKYWDEMRLKQKKEMSLRQGQKDNDLSSRRGQKKRK